MEMISLTDLIFEYLFLSSALLFILGVLSSFVLRGLKIQGNPRLLICILIIIMPLAYPIKVLLPDPIRVPIPLEKLHSFNFQTFSKITGRNPVSKDVFALATDSTSANQAGSKEPIFIEHETSSTDFVNRPTETASYFHVNWKLIVTLVWGLVFLYFLTRLVTIVYKTDRLLKLADPVMNPQILKLLHQCADDTGLRRAPHLLTMDGIPVPMVMGFFQPRIFLPKHLLKIEFREGLRFTLLHELKHVHQHHNWWLLIETLIGAAYFFHPVIHWAKKKIQEELEHICDSHVIHITNKSISYADFLLHEIWQQKYERNPALALLFVSGTAKTKNRVRSILENTRPTLFAQIRGRVAVGLIYLSFVSLLLCSVAPSAQKPVPLLQKIDPSTTDSQYDASFQDRTAEIEKEVLPKEKPFARLSKEQLTIDDTTDHFQAAIEARPDTYEKDTGTPFQEKPTYKPILKSEGPDIMADAGIQVEKIAEKQPELDSFKLVDEPASSIDEEDNVESVQNEPNVKVASDSVRALETNAEKYLGTPVNGLNLYRIKDIKIINDQTILYIMYSNDMYLSRLSDPCPSLLFAEYFRFNSITGKITKFDRILGFAHGNQILGSAGMLGDIYPYRYKGKRTEAIKLLKNGLMEELVAEGAFKEFLPSDG
jgi:beta-lactamase regulating signal transducer with metallopeptidase domain